MRYTLRGLIVINPKKYSEQVKEYIRCASLLAKINQSIISDHSCRMLADHYSYEKLKLDEMNDAYARSVAALSGILDFVFIFVLVLILNFSILLM